MHCYKASLNKQGGFTLIELLIVLGLISIMSSICAWPVYQQWLTTYRLERTAKQLFASLQFARMTAIQCSRGVTVCASDDGKRCHESWENGWIVKMTSSVEQVLYTAPPLYQHQCLTWRGARHQKSVQFQSSGTSEGYSGHFVLSDKRSQIGWRLIISQTGRIRLVFYPTLTDSH